MTLWKQKDWEMKYKKRFGPEVFAFIGKDKNLIEYLSDYEYLSTKLNKSANKHQLTDNSMFVLHICKIFEGVLQLIANETGWYSEYHQGRDFSIGLFYKNYRKQIEEDITSKNSNEAQGIIDKLFSTVGDFSERHEAVHYGSFIKFEEIENYDAILTKIKDVVKVLIDNKLLQ